MRESWRKNELMQQGRQNKGKEAERETKQRQRGREAKSTETKWVRRNVRRGVLAFWVKLGWSKVSIKSNGAFWVFFFLNFGLNRLFRPIRPIQAQFGLIRLALARVEATSARVGENHVARRSRMGGQRRPLRVAASHPVGRGCGTSSAASVLPRVNVSAV